MYVYPSLGILQTYVWSYKFSRLKGSSDDGKQKLKLHFSTDNPDKQETRVSAFVFKLKDLV